MTSIACLFIAICASQAVEASDLISAAKEESLVEIQSCLASGARVDSVDEIGQTALHHACHKGSLEIVQTLLESEANPNVQGMYGYTPLIFATEKLDIGLVDALLTAGANADLRTRDGIGPLYIATRSKKRSLIRILLEAGANRLAEDIEGVSPLELAAESGDRALFLLLRDGRPNYEVMFWDGVSPIVVELESDEDTSSAGRVRDDRGVVLYPIPLDRDTSGALSISWDGRTSAGEKVSSGIYFFEVEPFGPDGIRSSRTVIRTDRDPASIFAAVQSGRPSVVRRLLEGFGPIDVDARDEEGRTSLMLAAQEGQKEIVQLLLLAGADAAATDAQGKPALLYAMEHQNGKALYKMMLNHMSSRSIRR